MGPFDDGNTEIPLLSYTTNLSESGQTLGFVVTKVSVFYLQHILRVTSPSSCCVLFLEVELGRFILCESVCHQHLDSCNRTAWDCCSYPSQPKLAELFMVVYGLPELAHALENCHLVCLMSQEPDF